MAGAYKSTPIRCLETETWVPPLDLYLNKRYADFEHRLQQPLLQTGAGPGTPKAPAAHIITEACNRLFFRYKKGRRGRGRPARLGPQGPTVVEQSAVTVALWAGQRWKTGEKKGAKLTTSQVVELAWQGRWQQRREGKPLKRMADEDPPELLFTDKALRCHEPTINETQWGMHEASTANQRGPWLQPHAGHRRVV